MIDGRVYEFQTAYTTLRKLVERDEFDSNNRTHRVLVGTLITEYDVNEIKAEEMLKKLYFHIKTKTIANKMNGLVVRPIMSIEENDDE